MSQKANYFKLGLFVIGEVLKALAEFEEVDYSYGSIGAGDADTVRNAMVFVKLTGKDANQMIRLMDALDDHEDVKQVWSNFDIEEKEIEASLA